MAGKLSRTSHGLLICAMLALHACQPAAPPTIEILSLADQWDAMEASAQDLDEDAYLTHVVLERGQDSPNLLAAEYFTPNSIDELIFIGIDRAGEMFATWIDFPPSTIVNPRPIHRSDWSIDSLAAIELFYDDHTISRCLGSSETRILLGLNSTYTESPAWELTLIGCPDEHGSESYFLDAQTGSRIDPFTE